MLDGAKTLVLDGAQADAFIVAARTAGETTDEQGVTLFVIPAGAPGLSVREFGTLDGRSAAHLTLRAVSAGADAVLGQPGAALPAIVARRRATPRCARKPWARWKHCWT